MSTIDNAEIDEVTIDNEEVDEITVDGDVVYKAAGPVPGSDTLIAGNMTNGYFGHVAHGDLINGDDLDAQIGLTEGTNHNSTIGWLKFARNGTILFVAQRTTRYNVSWNAIHARGAVFGTRQITIDGNTYKVRCLTGDGAGTEWNNLMYGVSENTSPNWAQMTNADLGVFFTDWGSFTWVQESDGDYRVVRGDMGVTGSCTALPSYGYEAHGFRPVLELI